MVVEIIFILEDMSSLGNGKDTLDAHREDFLIMRGAKKGRWDSMRFYRLGHMKHGKEKQGFRRIGPSFR